MGPRPRPMWSRMGRALLAFAGLLVLLVAGGYLLLHTDWARDQIRAVLVGQLGKRLNGTVTVERLEGDLFDAVTLRNIEVRDRDRKLVLHVDSLSLDYRLLPLIERHFHADRLAIDGLEVELRRLPDGRLAVADLMIQQPPSDGAPWTTTLEEIALSRSSVKFESKPGEWDELARIEIEAGLAMRPDGIQVALGSLSAEWKNRDLALALTGDLRMPKSGGVVASGVELRAGGNTLIVPHAVWAPGAGNAGFATGAGNVAFVADVSAADLARLVPGSPLLADASLAGFVSRDPASKTARVHVFGGAGDASLSLWAEVGGDLATGAMGVFWAGVAPNELVAGAPEGRLDGWMAGEVAGYSLPWPPPTSSIRGALRGGTRGHLRDLPISDIAFHADLSQRRLTAAMTAGVPGGEATAELAAVFPSDLAQTGAIALERADLVANLRDVAELASAIGQPATSGPLSFGARASGRLDNLAVRARLESTALVQKQLHLSGVRADLRIRHADIQNLPGEASGDAELHVDSILSGGKSYGDAHVFAGLSDRGRRADVRFAGGGKDGISARGTLSALIERDAARVTFQDLRIATRKLVWQGRGSHLAVAGGGRELSGALTLSSPAGSLRVSAELTRGRDLRGPIKWQLGSIDLARVLSELGLPGVRGQVSSSGEIRLPGGPGHVDLEASRVEWPGGPQPVSGRVRAALERRKLDAQLDVAGAALGSAKAELVIRTPAALTDAAAWRRMRPAAVESLRLEGDKLNLARFVHMLDDGPGGRRLRSCLAQLKLEAGRGLESGKLTMSVTSAEVVASPEVVVPLTLDLEAELARATLTSKARADAGDTGQLELEAAVAVPGRPLDVASWRREGLDLIRSARIRLSNFNLEHIERISGQPMAGRKLELAGAVAAEITVGPAAHSLTAELSLRGVRVTKEVAPLSGQFTARAQAQSTNLALSVHLPSGPLVDGTLQIGLGADDVRRLDVDRLRGQVRAATLRGQLRIPDQPVVRLASVLSASPDLSGQVGGQLLVSGTLSKPFLSVQLDAPGFTTQGVRFNRLRVRARYEAGPWTASVDARQSDGGRISLDASGSPGNTAPLKVHMVVRRLRLGLFTPLWKRPGGMLTRLEGKLQADLDITGTAQQPMIDGSVLLREGEVRMARFLRPFTGARMDVKFRGSQAQVTLHAGTSPGKMDLTGTFDVRRPDRASFTAKLKVKKFPVEAGKQIVSIDGGASASGLRRGSMWDTDVVIDRGMVVRMPSQKGLKLHESGPLDDVVFVDGAGAAQQASSGGAKRTAGPTLRLRLRSQDLVEVRSDELAVDLRIKLTITQLGDGNSVDGSIEGVRGWIELFSRRYSIEKAWLTFGGEIPPDPRVDVRLSNQFPDTMVYIDVTGRVSAPRVTFASDSGQYDQAQLLSMILGGGDSQSATGPEPSEEARASAAAAGLVANQVAGMAREAGLPVDVLRVGTDPESESQGQVNEITVGKWLSDRLFVAYRYRETQDAYKNRNEGTFQFFFARDWMWEGVVGDRSNSIDLLWIVPLGR